MVFSPLLLAKLLIFLFVDNSANIAIREHQKINYSISGLELIALLPLPPAPCPLHFERLVIFLFGSPLSDRAPIP
jgi:hypothetical protein